MCKRKRKCCLVCWWSVKCLWLVNIAYENTIQCHHNNVWFVLMRHIYRQEPICVSNTVLAIQAALSFHKVSVNKGVHCIVIMKATGPVLQTKYFHCVVVGTCVTNMAISTIIQG